MNKKEFLNKVYNWQDKTFPTANASSKIYHLIEEVNELLQANIEFEKVRYDSSIGVGEYGRKLDDLKKEYADCFLLLFGAANKDNFNLDDVFELMNYKFEIIKNRKWGKPDSNGVVKHIKE